MELFEKKILELVGKKLIKKKQTVAVAESVTSGLLQVAFSQIPDAAHFFQGGITAYNLGQKFKHLHVEPIHAESCNCVSQQVADQMALHVVERFQSNWGISITGYATPVPESDNKLYCFYSIVYQDKVKARGKIAHRKADPETVQLDYVNKLMKLLNELV